MSGIHQILSHKQLQQTVLKPKMLQSLKLLTMTRLELEQFLKSELTTNPLLELREFDPEGEEERKDEEKKEQEKQETSEDTQTAEDKETANEVNELSEILDSWNEYNGYNKSKYRDSDDKTEIVLKAKVNRRAEYVEQLHYLNLQENENDFVNDMIESCNTYGFLSEDYDLYAVAKEYDITQYRADELHNQVLNLSPKGITSRSINECLLVQLKDQHAEDSIILRIVKEDFENLIHRRYHKIAPKYQVSQDYIIKIRDIIAKCDPKPGLRISEVAEDYVTPDVIIKMIEDEYEVIINDFYSPNLGINSHYRKMIHSNKQDKETVKYVRDKVNSARFLIKSIYMRRRTMERVVKAIIRHQQDFFYNNDRVLHPMTYAVIAEDLGISESTISRVVKDKYADTPFGVIPLKKFFSSTAGQDTNFESVSRQRVKTCIAKYIEEEDSLHPYSDQALVEMLRKDEMFISRRIVAKYRDEMGILNSRLRRRN